MNRFGRVPGVGKSASSMSENGQIGKVRSGDFSPEGRWVGLPRTLARYFAGMEPLSMHVRRTSAPQSTTGPPPHPTQPTFPQISTSPSQWSLAGSCWFSSGSVSGGAHLGGHEVSLVKDGWREPPVPCSMISWFAMDVCGGPHGDGAAADVPVFGWGHQ